MLGDGKPWEWTSQHLNDPDDYSLNMPKKADDLLNEFYDADWSWDGLKQSLINRFGISEVMELVNLIKMEEAHD